MQMLGPRDILNLLARPRAFSVVQKPWGWAHISVQKPRGAGGGGGGEMVTSQIDTCIILVFGGLSSWCLAQLLSGPRHISTIHCYCYGNTTCVWHFFETVES